ncbi:helix-turn-helix domain-containing protein [Sphingomonas sp. Tas61C01]|uniref:helix-turn-helix domain-containing protein n=1 Tax=Sphingomonas sp. Tas61C01 TaxID=3458297 RepID=UPI00403EA402
MLSDDLLAGAEPAARYVGVSPRAIYHLVESGNLPVRKIGRRLYFLRSELQKAFSPTVAADAAPVIVIADEPFGRVDVMVSPPPAGIGHDADFANHAEAMRYAERLRQATGWTIVDRSSSAPR